MAQNHNPRIIAGIGGQARNMPGVIESNEFSTCKIIKENEAINNFGTCFLIQVPINNGARQIKGFMTTHHFLQFEDLVPGNLFSLEMCSNDEKKVDIEIGDNRFSFTSNLLDVTFVELLEEEIRQLDVAKFLYPCAQYNDVKKGDMAKVYKPLRGGGPEYREGHINEIWGFNLNHDAIDLNEDQTCSALLNNENNVVGINIVRGNERLGKACHIGVVLYAIDVLNSIPYNNLFKARCPAKVLSNNDIKELCDHGLQATDNSYVFISPPTLLLVTQLWFYRTNHAWYWTPTNPKGYDINDLKKCNWAIINPVSRIAVRGGYWDGQQPAGRNIILIEWLTNTGLRFLA